MTRHSSPEARGEFLWQLLNSGRRVVLRKIHNAERMEMVVFMPNDCEVIYQIRPSDVKEETL
jgi:hypothetical protein